MARYQEVRRHLVRVQCHEHQQNYCWIHYDSEESNEWYYVSTLGAKKHLLPPGDMGWPFIGKSVSFFRAFTSTNPGSIYDDYVYGYGRSTGMYRTHLLGKPAILVCEPEACKRALNDTHRLAFSYPKYTMALSGERGIHGISAAEHTKIRRLIRPSLSGHDALSSYVACTEDAVIRALDRWAAADEPIELASELRSLFFRVLVHLMLGSNGQSGLGPVELYDDVSRGIFALPINFPGSTYHKALKASKRLIKVLRGVVNERKTSKREDQNKCTIDWLIEEEDEEGRKLDDELIAELLLTFLIGGHESSYVFAMWSVEEQENVIKNRPSTQKGLSFKEIKEMHYLRKVFDETMRLNQLFSLIRLAKEDVDLNGYHIPKGWSVWISSRAVHMNPEIHKDPKSFNPSRWDDNQARSKGFIGFGAGSRICAGPDITKLLNFTFLHHFLLKYKFKQLNPMCECNYLPLPMLEDKCLADIEKLQSRGEVDNIKI